MLNETHIHVHVHLDGTELGVELKKISNHLKVIAMTTQEAVDKINQYKTQLDKVRAEVQKLKDDFGNRPDVPADLADAINGLGGSVQAVDDINPDTETPGGGENPPA